MPIYKCPKCGRTVEKPKGTYYCRVCGPSAVMVEVPGRELAEYDRVMRKYFEEARAKWIAYYQTPEGKESLAKLEDAVKSLEICYDKLKSLTSKDVAAVPLLEAQYSVKTAHYILKRQLEAVKEALKEIAPAS
jgi:uncharacterized Zn finger protein (UPF0148 family)